MISTMELRVLHLLVDVVALGEGVGVLLVFLSIVLVCLNYTGVCTQHVYRYSVLLIGCLGCLCSCFLVVPPPSHTHVLACTCIDWLHALKGRGDLEGERERERERLLYYTTDAGKSTVSVTRRQEAHTAS